MTRTNREDTLKLFLEYAKSRSTQVRDQIITEHLNLVRKLIKPFLYKGQTEDSLYSTGCIALILAVDRFDPNLGVEFTTFAHATITGELKKHFRDQAWDVRVPRSLKEDYIKVNKATSELTQQLGKSPTIQDIAQKTSLDEERVLEAMDVAHDYNALSIQSGGDEDQTRSSIHEDLLSSVTESDLDILDSLDLKTLLDKLPKREQLIVTMIYFDDFSQQDVAKRLGISQIHVSRLLKQALESLKTFI